MDTALTEAHKAVYRVGKELAWGAPVLFSRSPDNVLFVLSAPSYNQGFHKSFEPETILIPAGPFLMGSQPSNDIPSHETPQHEVVLPFYRIGRYPVTKAQYAEFLKRNLSEGNHNGPIGQSSTTH